MTNEYKIDEHKWKKTFFIIAMGQAVSLIGSSAVQFAIIWWLAEETASPLMMGIAGVAAFLPMTLFSPFAGVAADRYNRKTICIISDLSTGFMALIYAVLFYYMDVPVWAVIVVLGLRGVGGTFQQPAIQSIIPQLVPADQLVRVNGWTQLMISGSFILGPVIGALMYAAVPLWVILLTDVIGAVFASITLAIVKVPRLVRPDSELHGFISQFKEGIEVYREDRSLFMLVLAQALCMFFYAPLSSFYPLMTSDFFKLSALHGSIVETAYAAGMMVSALLFSSVIKVRHKIGTAYVGLLGMGVACMLGGMLPPVFWGWLLFSLACAFMGAFGNVHSIPVVAYMQETIAPEKMGRAFSLLMLISSFTMPVGLLVGSPIAEKIGVHSWFFISGLGMIIIVIIVGSISRIKGIREVKR